MKKLSGSEAIYGFVGWLTTRKEVTKMGSNQYCMPIIELAKEFCETNRLKEPKEGWHKNLVHPK